LSLSRGRAAGRNRRRLGRDIYFETLAGRFHGLLKGGKVVKVGLFVRLEAKPGKEAEVAHFLNQGRALVEEEPGTAVWFALQLTPTTFAIFDAFADENGRRDHLAGRVAAALMAKAPDLLAERPVIEHVDVLAAKLPG
jgi:quinol monooxygenase YgiN